MPNTEDTGKDPVRRLLHESRPEALYNLGSGSWL